MREIYDEEKTMPRDVDTRWNSTYDMLDFAVDHREGIDAVCSDRSTGLRQYELDENEWEIAAQLCEVLKVCESLSQYCCTTLTLN